MSWEGLLLLLMLLLLLPSPYGFLVIGIGISPDSRQVLALCCLLAIDFTGVSSIIMIIAMEAVQSPEW